MVGRASVVSKEEFCVVKNEKGKAAVWKHFRSPLRNFDKKITDGMRVCYTLKAFLETGGGTTK